jgi:acetylornithine deacetylase/succinyl-diaminopimelate desuccinylase-like protein
VPEAAVSAWRDAWGLEPQLAGVGGYIPIVAMLARAAPQALLLVPGVGDPASNIHGPDESVSLDWLARTASACTAFLGRLGQA